MLEDGIGEYKKIENPSKYKIKASETLQFKYVYLEKYIESEVIPVVDVKYGTDEKTYSNFFVGNMDYVGVDISSFVYTFGQQGQTTGCMEFINTISLDNFVLSFKIPESKNNFKKLTLTLTDFMNRENKNVIVYETTDKGFDILINGKTVNSVKETITNSLQTVNYYTSSNKIRNNYGGEGVCNVFEGDLCMLSVEFTGLIGESSIAIEKINNHSLGEYLTERNPEIVFDKTQGVQKLGATAIVYSATVSSVFNPVLNDIVKVTVTDDYGNIVKSEDGILLNNVAADRDYRFVLTQVGNYSVEYTAVVSTGLIGSNSTVSATMKNIISVLDEENPKIIFDEKVNLNKIVKLKINEIHNVHAYTVTDNISESADIYTIVLVYNESRNLIYYGKNSFYFELSGKYEVLIFAQDEAGNFTAESYFVLVQ